MEITEILSEFERNRGYFPEKAVREAIARREEITPHLLAILTATVADAKAVAAEDDRMAHIYAMYMLAFFRDPTAFPLIIQYARLPGELAHDLGGTLVTEDLGRMLASVCGGDIGPIMALFEESSVDGYVRDAALRSLVVLVAVGRMTRNDLIEYLKLLFNGKLERQPSQAWNALVWYSTDLHPADTMPEIRAAYEDGLVDPGCITLDNVEEDLDSSHESCERRLRAGQKLIDDPVAEMGGWICFKPKPSSSIKETPKPAKAAVVAAPVGAKIARTRPCPCGSRRKYKKCCGKA